MPGAFEDQPPGIGPLEGPPLGIGPPVLQVDPMAVALLQGGPGAAAGLSPAQAVQALGRITGSGGTNIVQMSPSRYLELAAPFGKYGSRPINEATVAHFVKNPSYPNPMLTVKEGPEGLRVGMHDGRHRALAAQQQGQNLINVEISRGQKFKRENPNVTDADLAQRIQRENLLPEWDN